MLCITSIDTDSWSLSFPKLPSFHRSPLKHRIQVHPMSPCIFDDFYDTNSQAGSQWDGLRHFGHLGINKLYNNLDPSEVMTGGCLYDLLVRDSPNCSHRTTGTKCGIQAISQHGIAGRGVLLDYYAWAQKNGRTYDPTEQHAMTAAELKEVAKAQNVEFRPGDLLFIRGGYIKRYHELETENPKKLEELAENPTFAGVEQTEEMKAFLHDS